MSIHERIRRFSGLINVYKRREDALARRMRDAEALAERERAQLTNIAEIKADYQKGLLDAGRAGTSAQRMKNWQRFVRNLDSVHTEQIERTRRASGARDEHRDAWLVQYRRVKGFETLADNLAAEHDLEQRRAEQRHMDEIAGRAAGDKPREK
jgi:flagellar export protein FliJ